LNASQNDTLREKLALRQPLYLRTNAHGGSVLIYAQNRQTIVDLFAVMRLLWSFIQCTSRNIKLHKLQTSMMQRTVAV